MNKLLLMASALAFSTTMAMAQDSDVPTAYGWLASEPWAAQNGVEARSGLASFPLSSPNDITVTHPITLDYSLACTAYHDGLWYYMDYVQSAQAGYLSGGFYSLDPETGDVTSIADYASATQGPIAAYMYWSYADQKMYALNGLNGGNGLASIDLETGDIKTECLFWFDDNDPNDAGQQGHMNAIAENYDGDCYGISYWGKLYKINKQTGECHFIAKVSYLGEVTSYSGNAIQYPHNNLFYDEERGQWYFHMYTYPYPSAGYSMLMKLDVTTGISEVVENNPLGTNFEGLYVPFQVAEASAPAKVTDFTLTPGEGGALSVTLNWANPTKTFGRGGNLMSIDSVVVYRDGEAIKTFTGVAPGEELSYVDEVSESRFYNYRVQAFNEAGAGDRKALSCYIGHDTPKAVTDLAATVDDTPEHKITVSWTAPTLGIYDGWIDVDNMTYRVVRSDGDTIYEALTETTFTDAPASLASYSYTITAVTPDGESKGKTSNAVIGGPAVQLPHTFQFTEAEFPLWSVYDNNGDEVKWMLTSQYSYNAIYPGVYVGYSYYYGVAGADWIISPAIKFEAGKHYKLTLDARSYNAAQPEVLAVSMGKGADWAVQDSIDQWEFAAAYPVELRTNLPVLEEDGEWNVGFLARSVYQNWQLSIGNIRIEENHDGALTGKVTDAETGEIIPLAKVTASNAEGFSTEIWTNPETGVYTFKYLPAGELNIAIERLGYADFAGTATVVELETSTADFAITALPRHTLSGTILDKVGEPVEGAKVSLEGYNEYAATADAEGNFTIANIMASENYNLTISSNRLEAYQNVQPMLEDVNLGTIVLDDKILPPAQIKAELNEEGVPTLTWSNPVNDMTTLRYDANLLTNSLGTSQSSSYAVFGNIFRTPGLYQGAQFYLAATSQTIYGLDIIAFDLDENGEPTPNILGRRYSSVNQGDWTTINFSEPVSAPRGCYLAVQYYGFVGLGISEANDSYPFVEHVSCYTGDYTSGQFFYLEDAGYPYNFMLRATCSPYDVEEPAQIASFVSTEAKPEANMEAEAAKNLMGMPRCEAMTVNEPAVKMNTIGERTWFDLYRLTPATAGEPESWTQLLDSVSQRTFTDEAIKSLPMGTYEYAVRCHYTDGLTSSMVLSDTIGWQMHTTVTIKITTNTPTNEAEGAWVQIVNGGGVHAYGAYADENGEVVLENVWKANYDLYINLKGFETIFETVRVDTDDAYTFERQLTETQVTPFGLQVINDDDDAEEDLGNRLFIWNFPDQIFEGFEEHEAFSINSPGEIGWQYLDFDDPNEGTGYFSDMHYPNQGGSFAYQVFNVGKAENGQNYSYYFSAYQGQQMLASWANSTDQNWLVSPRLFFQEDYKFAFYAKGYGYNTESFMVGYTTSKDWTDTESYTWLEYVPTYAWEIASETFKANSYWTRYSFDIPAEANYVTIRQIDGNYCFMIDNICIGLPDGFPSAAPARRENHGFRAPSLDGAYKVYLDGELVGQTDDKQFTFENLDGGLHTAGVISSYTSGDTQMSTIEFYVDKEIVGIENINANASSVKAYDLQGRRTDSRQGILVTEGQKQLRK